MVCMTKPTCELSEFFATCLEEAREHAPYFALSSAKQENEADVARVLREELVRRGAESYHSIQPRQPGTDPPDCEATGDNEKRVGIEVTELVDESAIKAAIRGDGSPQNSVAPLTVVKRISEIIRKKDRADVRGETYDLYILVIYSDDPCFLDFETLAAIREAKFGRTSLVDRAYFLASYDPWKRCCPYVELALVADPTIASE